ncbi:MAG TPA: hypothetical protein VHA13_02320, partial [Gammaproteobacteria bacterium]|nr:hypothetical protein [Gammaproteobacteria bacterium]
VCCHEVWRLSTSYLRVKELKIFKHWSPASETYYDLVDDLLDDEIISLCQRFNKTVNIISLEFSGRNVDKKIQFLKSLPSHITIVNLRGAISLDLIASLPQHVTTLSVDKLQPLWNAQFDGITFYDIINHLPKHITVLDLSNLDWYSLQHAQTYYEDFIKLIPSSIKKVILGDLVLEFKSKVLGHYPIAQTLYSRDLRQYRNSEVRPTSTLDLPRIPNGLSQVVKENITESVVQCALSRSGKKRSPRHSTSDTTAWLSHLPTQITEASLLMDDADERNRRGIDNHTAELAAIYIPMVKTTLAKLSKVKFQIAENNALVFKRPQTGMRHVLNKKFPDHIANKIMGYARNDNVERLTALEAVNCLLKQLDHAILNLEGPQTTKAMCLKAGSATKISLAAREVLKEAAYLKNNFSKNNEVLDKLVDSLKLALKVIKNPKDADAVLKLKKHADNSAYAHSSFWKKLVGALSMLAGAAIIGLSIAGIPFTGGLSATGMYIGGSLLAAGGAALFYAGCQKKLFRSLISLAEQAEQQQPLKAAPCA